MKNNHYIKTGLISTALYALVVMGTAASFSMTAHASPNAYTDNVAAASQEVLPSGNFIKKKKSLKGSWTVIQQNGQTIIRFSDDFKTKNGPDLKVFLSPQSIGSVTGDTATDGSILLGKLQSNKGGQDYVLPAGVSLPSFNSVLVHCEAYSILWGGGAL